MYSVSYHSIAGTVYSFSNPRRNIYQIVNTATNRITTYTAPTTFAHDRDLLIKAGERVYRRNWRTIWTARLLTTRKPTPPTTPAAMPLVRQQSTVYAVSDRRTDNKILTIPHGQYYSARHSSLVYIIGQFTIKYGVRPTSLRMNPIEEADWLAGDNWDGIAVEFVDGVPEDTYYLHYDPALANAA
jgi:hypothetical protein